ncbi:hypothetical protein LguiA_007035 [Lonicera macranthoides]
MQAMNSYVCLEGCLPHLPQSKVGSSDSEANLLTLPFEPHAKETFYKDTRHWFAKFISVALV